MTLPPEAPSSSTPPHPRGRTIVFSHANSFPACTYERLFEVWRAAGWTVHSPAKFGHDSAYPVASNWPHQRDELVHHIERVAPGERVHLVGHSLGGYLSLLAACRHPELAAGVVMLDSPLVIGWRAHGVRAFKATGLIGHVSPSRISRKRRDHWADEASLRAHIGSRAVFQRWDARVLDDYLRCGFEPAPGGGWRLAFRPEVESRFYDTLPHHLGSELRRHAPSCPVAFIAGTRSAEMRQVGTAGARRVAHERWSTIEGSHLFPMERPVETAQCVLRWLHTP